MSRRLLVAVSGNGSVVTPPTDPDPEPIVPIPDNPIPYAMPSARPYNPPVPCPIATYDGSDQTVHPTVHDFGVGNTWQGYRFWMCITPYPNGGPEGGEPFENPSIYASNNAWDWHTPVGLTNPIFPRPGTAYNSDPDFAWDPVNHRMELVYRPMDQAERVVRSYSTNGINWEPFVTIMPNIVGGCIAPSLIRLSATSWRIYGRRDDKGIAYWTATSMAGPWSGPNECVIDRGGIPQAGAEYIWHIDAIGPSAATGGRYLFLVADGSLTKLYAGWSSDGVNITFADDAFLANRPGEWDQGSIYRASMTLHENGTHARVWYSGANSGGVSKTGLTTVPLTEWS